MTTKELINLLELAEPASAVEIKIANSLLRIPIKRLDLTYRDLTIIIPDEPLFREIKR